LFNLRYHRVADAIVTSEGEVKVTFDEGISIAARPDGKYENWAFSGVGLNLVCRPSGGVMWLAGDLPPL
jgi:hypothetical protein